MANEQAKLRSFSTIERAVDSLDQDVFWTAHGRIRVRPLYASPRFKLIVLSDTVDWHKGKEWFITYINDSKYRFYREGEIDTLLYLDSLVSIKNWEFIIMENDNMGHETYSFICNDPVTLTKYYKNKLKIETDEGKSTIIILKSEGPVGEREADFLNVLSQTYMQSELERRQQIADNTFLFIDDQINVILDSLNRAEERLLTFRLSNNVISLSQEGEIAYERLKSFHDQRTQLNLKEIYYSYLKKYIEERNDPQTIIAPTMTDASDRLLISAVQQLQELYEERENLDISVKSDNPRLESINTRILSIRLRIIEIVKGLLENNRLRMEQLDTEEQAIINQMKSLPLNEQQLLNIMRKYDLYNQFYTYLLEKRAEAGIQKASTLSNARILDPARYDQLMPIGSDKRVNLLVGLLLGLLIPVGALTLRNILDNRIREREDITENTNIPIIGIIGHASNADILPVNEDPSSSFTESLRRIRTNLAYAQREKEQKVIMVTSSISGEGKTFCAANIAAVIAMNRRKVLLIGCDLRKPTLHRIFNISNESGLTSFIIGNKTLQEVIIPTNIEHLFLIPAGPVPPNPAELIETEEMRSLFEAVRNDYDYIIFDTPPIAMVADALSLATYADLTLYLVRQNHSRKGVLEFVNAITNEDKLPKTYLLINDIRPSKSMGTYYYYGYGKGYNYGYYTYSERYGEE